MKKQIQKIQTVLSIAVILFSFALSTMSFSVASEAPCATPYFEINNNGCEEGCTIYFDNQSINATSYHWDFGDGTTSTLENPNHDYSDAGTYTVRLTAIDGTCESSFIGIVDIVHG